jgi:hypothetical protein
MGDFGDLIDMFSNNADENNTKNKKDTANNGASGNDIKSQLLNKVTKNKTLLVSTIIAGTVIVGLVAFFVIKYIGTSGIKNISDGIKPLTE